MQATLSNAFEDIERLLRKCRQWTPPMPGEVHCLWIRAGSLAGQHLSSNS